MKHTVAITKCLLKNCHPCQPLLRVGVAAIADFARYLLAWHPWAQEHPLSAQGQTSATQGPPHTLAQLVPELGPVAVPELGPVAVPGHKMGPVGRDLLLWQQLQKPLLHLRETQVALVLPTVHVRSRNRSVS